jgi:DNA repair protein RecN (Recombination protein N)
MLRFLRISNFALINHVELQFEKGFTVITGETGSGKSILLNALNLILGERADFSVIGPNAEKSVVEAEFYLTDFDVKLLFNTHDLDYEHETIIRREIYSNGKSRAFINDTPVSLNILKELTEKLIHIHSQYNTLELKNKNFQLDIIDELGDLKSLKDDFKLIYTNYVTLNRELQELKERTQTANLNQDYIHFQLNELQELKLDQTDYSLLEKELERTENSEQILESINAIVQLVEQDGNMLDRLQTIKNSLDRLKGVDVGLDAISDRIESLYIELKEIAHDSRDLTDKLEVNPNRIGFLIESLNQYNHVLNKHKLNNQEQLNGFMNELLQKITDAEEIAGRIGQLEQEERLLYNEMLEKAAILHGARCKAVETIENRIKVLLAELKLPETNLVFELQKRQQVNQSGETDVSLLFSANKGMNPVPIEKAASGGELSRVMLALQKMLSEKKVLPTVLFDEIDTGVSGDVAQKIGLLLQNMGDKFQLIAISHLPQVAAKATNHMKVEKASNEFSTQTTVLNLNADERIEEIARLMSGEQITPAAIANAKALMN